MSNKSSHFNGSATILCILLAVIAGALYTFSLKQSNAVYEQSGDIVREIQRLDASWSMEAVKVRSNPQADFDSLAAYIPKLDRLKEQLTSTVISDITIPERLVDNTNAFINQMNAKEEQIERFKSGYAIIRNSERYLPLAASIAIQFAQNNNQYDVVDKIMVQAEEINSYLANPNEANGSRIKLSLDSLFKESTQFEPNLAKAIAGFISHGNVLLDTSIPTETLFTDATSSNTAEEAENLVAGFKAMNARTSKRAKHYEYGAFAAIGALILVSLITGLRKGRIVESSEMAHGHDGETMSQLPGSNQGSDISYQMFAGMIGDNMVRALGRVKSDSEALKDYSEKLVQSFNTIEASISGIDSSSYAGNKGLVTLKSELGDSFPTLDKKELPELINSVERSYKMALHLAKQLTDYAGKENDADHEWININDTVRETVLPTNYNNEATVDIRLGDIPHIYGSAPEIKFLIKNIVDNAVNAVQSNDKENASIKVQTQMFEDQISITVTDNGIGIEPEKRKYLTQLFKPGDQGKSKLDLGLPSASYLVRRYGGKLLLNSVQGKGTAVRIMLPEARQAA